MHTSFDESINITLFYFKCIFHLKNATNLGNRNAETVKRKSQKKKKKLNRKNLYFFILSKREKRSAHLNLWDTNKELTYQDKL